MSSQYVADYVKEQEHDESSEREHFERETESIPEWMDEERITARAYEGLDEDYGHYANEERVEAYQEEAREEERESAYRIKAW
jgi:hypothetical protein